MRGAFKYLDAFGFQCPDHILKRCIGDKAKVAGAGQGVHSHLGQGSGVLQADLPRPEVEREFAGVFLNLAQAEDVGIESA